MLWPALGLLLVLAWFLAFRQTFGAVALHWKLEKEMAAKNDLSYNPELVKRRAAKLHEIVSRFEVDSAEWKNEFWLKTSHLASRKGVRVIYNASPGRSSDSVSAVLRQTIEFKGGFRDLVLLLDSIETIEHLGNINSLNMTKPVREDDGPGISMRLSFGAIRRTTN